MRCWIGVASLDHVMAGVGGGFCQLGHGKAAPVRRLAPGDRLVYYSPRTRLTGGEPIQAFTAIGEILEGDVHSVDMDNDFHPFRRAIHYFPSQHAVIRPLLQELSFTCGKAQWGMVFRRSVFKVDENDFHIVAEAMRLRSF